MRVQVLIAIQIAVYKKIAYWIASMMHFAISIETLTCPKIGIGITLNRAIRPIILAPALVVLAAKCIAQISTSVR